MLKVDMSQVAEYEKDLKAFARRAFPFATKQTMNRAAFETRTTAQRIIETKMVTRNAWTKRSVQVEMAKGLDVRRQEAIVGSLQEYMATQEFGGTVRGNAEHKPIATSYSAGQAENATPRKRLPRKPNKMRNITLKRRGGASMSRRQRNLVAVKAAAEGGDKYVYLDLGKRAGIFRVLGGKRRPRVKMVWDLSRSAVTVPRNPWLTPATERTTYRLPEFYRDALLYQLKRQGILGY